MAVVGRFGWPSLSFNIICKNTVSWYGIHPRYSKAEIAALLPPGACKHCVYWFRCAVGSSPDSWYQEYTHCPRCGIAQWNLLAELNQRLLGFSTPHQSRKSKSVPPTRAPHQPPTGIPNLDKLLALYQSKNPEIRIRAALTLVQRSDAPLPALFDILDSLWSYDHGDVIAKNLLKQQGSELFNAMIVRLNSRHDYVRMVACNVLGHSNDMTATPHLLRMIDDPDSSVRRAAGLALAHLKDPSSIPELKCRFAQHRKDQITVVWALQDALKALGVEAKDHSEEEENGEGEDD